MKIRAFSIAEAFIMLLVVSVAIGLSAPMMTKQIKHNNLSSVRANLFEREIERLQRQINDLRIVVEESVVPQGTIVFCRGLPFCWLVSC